VKTIAIIVGLLCTSVPCFAQTFSVDPVTNCPGLGSGKQYLLLGQTYYIEYVSGAWSPVADDSQQGGFTWESRITWYDYGTTQSGVIGSPAFPGFYQTPAQAEAAALGVYPIQGHGTVVEFYCAETSSSSDNCADNRGSVTLRFVSGPLPVHPTTWGAVKALYQ